MFRERRMTEMRERYWRRSGGVGKSGVRVQRNVYVPRTHRRYLIHNHQRTTVETRSREMRTFDALHSSLAVFWRMR